VAEQLCYQAVRTEIENAFLMPRECLATCLRSMANALIQDVMLHEMTLPDVLNEASCTGDAKKADCVLIDEPKAPTGLAVE
jgi:hypothetical protein